MRKLLKSSILLWTLVLVVPCQAVPLPITPGWVLQQGLEQPESVIYDAKRSRLYVSNIQGQPLEKDGHGYLAMVSLEGQLLQKDWIKEGLNAPKGMAITGDILYVADIDTLVAINIQEAKIITRYEAKEAKFLNDVTADSKGRVYVSDMFTNTIYCLCEGKFSPWVQSAQLIGPNGLFAEKKALIFGGWGVITDGFNTSTAGHLKKINYVDKEITSLGEKKPIGNLDGVVATGQGGYYVTDFMAGKLFQFDAQGHASELMKLKPGTADLTYIADKQLLIIPMMQDNELRAFLTPHKKKKGE